MNSSVTVATMLDTVLARLYTRNEYLLTSFLGKVDRIIDMGLEWIALVE